MALGVVALNADVLSPADGETVGAGAVEVRGYTFAGGERHVTRVGVSLDPGATCSQPELFEDLGLLPRSGSRASRPIYATASAERSSARGRRVLVVEAEDSWSGSTETRLVDGRFLGVLGYAPRHFDSSAALLADCGDRLRALRGQRLRRSFAVWEGGVGSALRARLPRHRLEPWFCDAPVILDFGVTRLELAGFKFHLCVSWDLIDVADPIEWGDFRLEWREDAHRELARLRDRTIETVRLVEYQGTLNGMQFCSGPDCVEVFNALDELGITDAPESDPEATRVEV
jgi:hypothetical protein